MKKKIEIWKPMKLELTKQQKHLQKLILLKKERGYWHSEKTKRKIGLANRGKQINVGENNPLWKGENVGYYALHQWVRFRLPKPERCPMCNASAPANAKRWLDLANISQEYKRDLTDWEWLCRKCHMTKDGRLEKFMIIATKRTLSDKKCRNCGKLYKGIDLEEIYSPYYSAVSFF